MLATCKIEGTDSFAYLRMGVLGLGGKDGVLDVLIAAATTAGRLSSLGWALPFGYNGWRTVLSQMLCGAL